MAVDRRPDGVRAVSGADELGRSGGRRMRHAVVTAALVGASAATSVVETYRDIEIAAERRRGGVQLNNFVSEPTECWLEEACRAG